MNDTPLPGEGPLLRDGLAVGDLLDFVQKRMSMRVWHDDEIYELEMDRIFTRGWVGVGHESEIPNPGDFVHRYIGEDPVIVTRSKGGDIHVLLNMCTHRGAAVCRVDQGNSRTFRCSFHGWNFENTGRLLGVPLDQSFYGRIDRTELGLRSARVATRGGIIFACWDESAPSLETYLGEYAFYIDAVFARTDKGLVAAGPPVKWTIHGNWKMPAEQHQGDSYHSQTTHESLGVALGIPGLMDGAEPAVGVGVSINGHGGQLTDFTEGAGAGLGEGARLLFGEMRLDDRTFPVPPVGMTQELVEEMPSNLKPDQIEMYFQGYVPTVGTVFPSTSFIHFHAPTPDGLGYVTNLRFWIPRGPERTEVVSMPMVEPDAPDDFKEKVRRVSQFHFGATGLFEADDGENWGLVARGVRGTMGRRQWADYQAIDDETTESEKFPGPGPFYEGENTGRDTLDWHYYVRWREFMIGQPFKSILPKG